MGVAVVTASRLSWLRQRRQLLPLLVLTLGGCPLPGSSVFVHAVVYFQSDDEDGTTCINGICYGIDPVIYKEIPMFNDCVDLRANCPQRVRECRHPNENADKANDDDDKSNYSLVSTTKSSSTTRLSSSSLQSSSSSSLSSWRYVQAHCPKTCGVCAERIRSVPLHEAWEPPPIGYPDHHVVFDVAARHLDDYYYDDDLNLGRRGGGAGGGGVVQILDADGTHDHVHAILERLDAMRDYLQNEVLVQDRYKPVRHLCVNHNEYCAHWAVLTNACVENAWYMKETCPAVCLACHVLHPETKCPKHSTILSSTSNNENAWKRGDLHRMFQSLVSDPYYAQYSPKTLSRPQRSNSNSISGENNGGPWIVQLDDFLNDAEVDRFLHYLGAGGGARHHGNKNKKRAGSALSRRITTTRNSQHDGRIRLTNSAEAASSSHVRNCTRACAKDEIVLQVLNRLERLTGIPVNNTEPLQLYRSSYTGEEKEESGHDFLEYQVERLEGPRILSIVLFLNDHQEQHEQQHIDDDFSEAATNKNDSSNTEDSSYTVNAAASAARTSRDGGGGGQIVFPRVNHLSIAPQRGRALIWPNVMNDNPNQPDFRTVHYTTRPAAASSGIVEAENQEINSTSTTTYTDINIADGVLFRVNLWLHLRDFATAKEMGCA
jgi:ShK domain-like